MIREQTGGLMGKRSKMLSTTSLTTFAACQPAGLRTAALIKAYRQHDKQRLRQDRSEPEIERKNGVHVARRGANDWGTPERRAKGDLDDWVTDTTHSKRSRGGRETYLDRYRRRSELDPHSRDGNERLWKAGHELRKEFRKARFEQRTVADLLSAGGGGLKGPEHCTITAADARHEYQAAMVAVGVVLAPVLVHVVCLELGGAQHWAEAHGQVRTDGLALLRAGLKTLARHFGI
jgi:Domain of unknown function (DUF6456)